MTGEPPAQPEAPPAQPEAPPAAPPPAAPPQKTPQQLQQEAMMAQMPTDRPTGVTLLGILYFVKAGFMFALAVYAFFYGIFNIFEGAWICAIAYVMIAFLYMMIATMLFMMKSWAWMWALIFAFFGILSGISSIASSNNVDWIDGDYANQLLALGAIELILNLVIVIYLWKMKDQFSNEPIQMPQQPGMPPQ